MAYASPEITLLLKVYVSAATTKTESSRAAYVQSEL